MSGLIWQGVSICGVSVHTMQQAAQITCPSSGKHLEDVLSIFSKGIQTATDLYTDGFVLGMI